MTSNDMNDPIPPVSNFSIWLIEDRVILTQLSGAFDKQDAIAGIHRVGEMMQQGKQPVHLIMDMRGSTKFTTNFRDIIPEIMQFRQQMTHSWAVMITEAKLIRFFGTLVANTLRGRFQIAKDVEDALSLLRSVDTSLRDLPTQPLPTPVTPIETVTPVDSTALPSSTLLISDPTPQPTPPQPDPTSSE